MENIYPQFLLEGLNVGISWVDVFKIPLVILMIGILLYSFLLVLKVKILVDTIDSEGNKRMLVLAYINLLISLFATIIGTIIILLV